MNLQIFREKAQHSPRACDFFDFDKLDAFHSQEVLSVIYGDTWESVLLVDGDKAFLHTFAKQKITNTDWYDIEPFLGYSGPVVNTDDVNFIESALAAYSLLCKEENIIAEIIRFNPLLQNHIFFESSNYIDVFAAKEIAIANCFEDEDRQMQEFKSATRRNIKNYAIHNYNFNIYKSADKLDSFINMYASFMTNINAKEEWFFSKTFFDRVKKSSCFKIAEVDDEQGPCSASLVIEHKLASYYFLGANKIPRQKGSHEFLLLNISIYAANNHINKLILGGGNTADPEDSLLVYKKKFVKESQIFYMGKLVHNPNIFTALCQESINRKPEIVNTNFFLKYRL